VLCQRLAYYTCSGMLGHHKLSGVGSPVVLEGDAWAELAGPSHPVKIVSEGQAAPAERVRRPRRVSPHAYLTQRCWSAGSRHHGAPHSNAERMTIQSRGVGAGPRSPMLRPRPRAGARQLGAARDQPLLAPSRPDARPQLRHLLGALSLRPPLE
jgi:hypothetical protein